MLGTYVIFIGVFKLDVFRTIVAIPAFTGFSPIKFPLPALKANVTSVLHQQKLHLHTLDLNK